jgi:O-antigen ligase
MNLSRTFAGAGLILLPFIFELSGDDQLRAPKAKMLFIMAAFYVAGLLWQRGLRPLAAGLAVAFISAYFSKTIFPYDDMAVFLAAGISCLWVDLSPLLITDTPEKYDFDRFFKLAEGVGLVAAAYAFVQIVGHDPILNYYSWADHGRPVIFFGQHTLYGPWAVAVFAIALFRRHWIRAAVLLVPILFINSSFTFLSLAVVLGLFLVQRIPFRFVALAAFLGFLGLAVVHQARPDLLEEPLNDKGRFVLWDQTLELGMRHWVIGYGPGSFRVIYPVFQDEALRRLNGIKDQELSPHTIEFMQKAARLKQESGYFLNPHNSFLHVFFTMGAAGLLAALWILLQFSVDFWQKRARPEAWILAAIFYSALANSLGNFPFELIPQALFPLWAYVAMTTMRRTDNLEEYVGT